MQRNKRKSLIIALVAACALTLFSCSPSDAKDGEKEKEEIMPPASVTFIDVGEGDSIYASFPDGKNLLIDCGEASEKNYANISDAIIKSGRDDIDTLILTNAEPDHVGGAVRIINEFGVKNAYIPYIIDKTPFPAFAAALEALEDCGAKTEISVLGKTVSGENYFYIFLSPRAPEVLRGAYDEFNSAKDPSEKARKNISAVVYAECFGVRFLFTGDAGKNIEEDILLNYGSGIFDKGAKRKVSLECIDFLKVADHGSSGATGKNFASLISPVNAVVSVGYNFGGHPSTNALAALNEANPAYKLYRTDVTGSVFVGLEKDGRYTVKKENKNV